LRPANGVPIIPKSPSFSHAAIFRGIALLDKFEEFGKRIDEEFARLKSIKNLKTLASALTKNSSG